MDTGAPAHETESDGSALEPVSVPVGAEASEPRVEAPNGGFRWGAVGSFAAAVGARPAEVFAAFRWGGGFLRPILFSVLLAGPGVGLSHILDVQMTFGRLAGHISVGHLCTIICFAPPLYVLVRSLAVHWVIVAQGAATRRFEATFRAVTYANGAVAWVWIVPIAGSFVFLVWATLVEHHALRSAQRLTSGAAIRAIVFPTFALLVALAARVSLEWLVGR